MFAYVDADDRHHTACRELLESHHATRVFLAPTMLDSMLAVAANRSLEPRTQRFENVQLQTLKGAGAGTLGTVSFSVIFTPYQA